LNNLIVNEEETRKFIEKVLLQLENDEVYLAVLTTRKKYCSTISESMEVVKREIIRNNDTNKTIRKLKRMSIVEGIYTDNKGNDIPVEAFALYILPEPRSMIKGYIDFTESINKWNLENLKSKNKNLELYKKLDIKLFSSIHKSKSKSNYFIIDIDRKDESLLNYILNIIKNNERIDDTFECGNYCKVSNVSWISETNGGYHVILNRNDVTGKAIHEIMMKNIPDVEFRKETMTPVVGSSQGGFVVKEYMK
jgi:hypothetical protein